MYYFHYDVYFKVQNVYLLQYLGYWFLFYTDYVYWVGVVIHELVLCLRESQERHVCRTNVIQVSWSPCICVTISCQVAF